MEYQKLAGILMIVGFGLVFFFDVVYASFPPQFFYLLTLIVGIVALQQ